MNKRKPLFSINRDFFLKVNQKKKFTDGTYTMKHPGRAKKKPHQMDSVKKNRTRTVTPSQTTKKQPIKRKRKNSDEKFDSMALMHDALRDMGVKKIKK